MSLPGTGGLQMPEVRGRGLGGSRATAGAGTGCWGTAEGWFGPRKVRRTVTGRQAAPRETAWPHRRGVRDAPWRLLVRWIGAWQKPLATSWHMARIPAMASRSPTPPRSRLGGVRDAQV